MAFVKRICMVIIFMLLRSYSADSNMEESHFSHNHPSFKKLIKPLSYEVLLQLPINEDDQIFLGETKYFFVIKNPTRKIDLNTNGLTISQLSYARRYPYLNIYFIKNYSHGTETTTSYFETEIPSGFYVMVSKSKGNISEKIIGVYRTSCKDSNEASKWIFTTQLKQAAARRVFPCWDEPLLKARFSLAIAHHQNYTVLSNMPIKSQAIKVDGMIWTQFHPTLPIPTYLLALSLTNFVCNDREAVGFTTRVCCRQLIEHQTKLALNASVNDMTYLQWYMGISQQLSNIIHIDLPDFPYDVTRNWGLNIFRESQLIYNETLYSIDKNLDVCMYMASMTALQWFGYLVSPTRWTHMWFFRTLALFYGAKAAAKIYPDKNVKFMFIYRLQSLAREDNAVSKMFPVMYEANNQNETDKLIKSYNFNNYLKEYAIMVMLENVVTEKTFQNAIIKCLKKQMFKNIGRIFYPRVVLIERSKKVLGCIGPQINCFRAKVDCCDDVKLVCKWKFSTATPNDFWNAIQNEFDNTKHFVLYHQPSVVEIVQNWLEQKSLPVITVERADVDDVMIRQEYMNIEERCDNINNLWIPINCVTMSDPKNTRLSWLKGLQLIRRLQIPLSDWVIVNWQHVGYYRVKYDDWSWRSLTNYLNSTDYVKIHVLSRAHIIEDAHYFWSQKKLHISKFIDLISFMGREKQCAPWYAMHKVIQKMWTFLNIDVGKPLRDAILDVLSITLQEVGYLEHPDDVECVIFKRLLATKWACRLFHEECLEIAKQRLIEHMKDPKSHIIPPMWKEWTYCNGLVRSDMETWLLVFKEFEETKNMTILEYLGCSGNSSIIINYLTLLKTIVHPEPDEFGLTVKDRQNIYRSTIEKHISRIEVLDYVLKNIKNLIDEAFVEDLCYVVEKAYSSTQMDKIILYIISLLEGKIDPNFTRYRERIRSIVGNRYLHIFKLEQLAY